MTLVLVSFFFVLFFFTQHVITRISSRVPLYCIVVDQINKLPEDGLKSSPEMSHYIENTWISRKIKIKLYFCYTLLIHFTVCLDKPFKYSNFCIPLQASLLSIAVSNDLINIANSIGLPENVIIFSVGNLTSFLMKNYVFFFINNYSVWMTMVHSDISFSNFNLNFISTRRTLYCFINFCFDFVIVCFIKYIWVKSSYLFKWIFYRRTLQKNCPYS